MSNHSDYPDYTDIMQIIGSDIMVPLDLQAAYIQMPVDIQAQYASLDINIKTQTVTINIDINAQSVGVYLQPDWQVKAGTDKNESGYVNVAPDEWVKVFEYQVPAGKTFYICQWGFNAEADVGLAAQLRYYHDTTETMLAMNGGHMGGAQSFTKPIAIEAGEKIRGYAFHLAPGTELVYFSVGGYEI